MLSEDCIVTNATKAIVGSFVTASLNLIPLFTPSLLSAQQVGGLNAFFLSGLGVLVVLTYKNSQKRVPDGTAVVIVEDGKVAAAKKVV